MRAWVVAAAALLGSGCIATTGPQTDAAGGEAGAVAEAQPQGDIGPRLQALLAQGLPERARGGLAEDRRRAAYAGMVPARLPALQARAEATLRRLTEALPGAPDLGGVWLRPRNTFHAVALPDGLIAVNLGTLLELESEAELAALLAHELAHVLAGHHAQLDLQAGLNGATDAARAVELGFSQDLDVDYAELEDVQRATNGVLFPAWSRGQERAADRLGMDLLVNAGYSPDAMLALLERVQALTPERAEWSPLTAVSAEAVLEDPQRVERLEDLIDVEALRAGLEAEVAGAAGATHDAPEERLRLAREYLMAHFATLGPRQVDREALARAVARDADAIEGYLAVDRIRRELRRGMPARSLREALAAAEAVPQRREAYGELIAAFALEATGDRRGALAALQAAVATGEAPYAAYSTLIGALLGRGEADAAAPLIAAANRRFDDPQALLPAMIAMHGANGARLAMLSARARCLASLDSELIERCREAAGQ